MVRNIKEKNTIYISKYGEGKCTTCKKAWCDKHNCCSSKCNDNCKTNEKNKWKNGNVKK